MVMLAVMVVFGLSLDDPSVLRSHVAGFFAVCVGHGGVCVDERLVLNVVWGVW